MPADLNPNNFDDQKNHAAEYKKKQPKDPVKEFEQNDEYWDANVDVPEDMVQSSNWEQDENDKIPFEGLKKVSDEKESLGYGPPNELSNEVDVQNQGNQILVLEGVMGNEKEQKKNPFQSNDRDYLKIPERNDPHQ